MKICITFYIHSAGEVRDQTPSGQKWPIFKFCIILEEKYPAVKIRANKIRVGENF